MKGFRFAVPVLASALLLGAASTAYADQLVGMPMPTGPDGATLLPKSGQSQTPDSTTAQPSAYACTGTGSSASFTGLIGTPKQINFQSYFNCGYPITSIWGQNYLYFDEFVDASQPFNPLPSSPGYETQGTGCASIPSCVSYGSYNHLTRTAPWMVHIIYWNVYATVASGYRWVDNGSGSYCSGYYTRSLSCSYPYSFSVPI
jgi:hypothetical protein